MLGQTSHHHKTIVWNRQSGPSQRCTVFMRGGVVVGGERSKRSRSPRRTKLVELEHLQNWEIPRFSRPARPEGSLSTGRGLCARCAVHSDIQKQDITERPSPLINTVNHCMGTRWTIALLDWTCDITMFDQWSTALRACTRESNVNRESFFPLFPFPAMQSQDKLRHNLYGNYYHSLRKALQNKAPGPANPTDFLYNKSETMQKFKDSFKSVMHMHGGNEKPSANM